MEENKISVHIQLLYSPNLRMSKLVFCERLWKLNLHEKPTYRANISDVKVHLFSFSVIFHMISWVMHGTFLWSILSIQIHPFSSLQIERYQTISASPVFEKLW